AADRLQFAPAEPLATGATYHAALATDAASAQQVALVEPLSFDIFVAGDLQVGQVFPADGALEVESNAVITVIFNRPIVPLMIVEDQAGLPQPLEISPPLAGYGEWLNTSVYVFHPDEALLSSTAYTARVDAGLTDTIGSQLLTPYEWQFTTTAPGISSFGIEQPVGAANPEDNYTDVRLESSFYINFRQPMNQSSVAEALSLYSQQGEAVPVDLIWEYPTRVVITPTQYLALGTDYTLMLTENARSDTGGTLAEGLRWNFRTVMLPAVLGTYPADGTTQSYYSSRFAIEFVSPMKLDTIKDRVIISPEIDTEIEWYYSDWNWSADFYGLKPSTAYTVQILPGMEDIYGNAITAGTTVRFTTAAREPSAYLDLPYAPVIYRVDGPQKFYANYVNVNTVDFGLYELPVTTFAGFSSGTYSRWDYIPPEGNWVNQWHQVNAGKLNERTRVGIPLETASGDPLSPGFYFLTIDSPQVSHNGTFLDTRLLVVAEANLTFKTTQTEALMWLTDLENGAPLNGVSLIVYDSNFQQVGQGATNSDGLLSLDLPLLDDIYAGRYVMTNEGEPFAFAIDNWGSGVSPYDFGIWSNYYTLPNQPTAYVYTDRPLYRPGQPVSFKGIVRLNDDLDYSLPPWESVEVTIDSYDETVYQETLSLSEFGSFDGELLLDDQAALGYYSIQVRSLWDAEDEDIGGVGFSVAEYRKPEFQVTTAAEPIDVLAGQDFTVDVTAEYYAGGGVA
ncbi:MAG: Ig-like domain-containing protein, partial [Chloroflexi bacterium]|nr:Ig-like domain-containing protein [Chloroflexota bacterium]